jgi:hypothetical protein
MSVDTDLKASLILEDFSKQLSDAVVGYRYAGGHHEFTIQRGGETYCIDFPERLLLEHPIRELEKLVPKLIRQLVGGGAPETIRVSEGTPGFCETWV